MGPEHLGAIAALGTALCWSLSSIVFTFASGRLGAMTLNRVRLVFAVVLLGTAHLAVAGSFVPVDAGLDRWLLLGASGIVGLAIGDTCLFLAFTRIGPRKSMIVMSTVPILSAAFAWIWLHEAMTVVEGIGILVVVAGVAVVVAERTAGPAAIPGGRLAGFLAALAAAVAQAAALVLAKRGMSGDYSSLSATQIRMVVAAAAVWTLGVLMGQAQRAVAAFAQRRSVALAAAGAVLGPFLGVWLSLFAVQHASVGVAASLMALVPVFVIPWVRIFFGERVSARALGGTLLACAGTLLLLLGG